MGKWGANSRHAWNSWIIKATANSEHVILTGSIWFRGRADQKCNLDRTVQNLISKKYVVWMFERNSINLFHWKKNFFFFFKWGTNIFSCAVRAEAQTRFSWGQQVRQGNGCPVTSHDSNDELGQRDEREWWEHSHGSLPMNCGPGLCWEGGGLGVPTSLFLAILVLALANSSLKVWGISGSNRTPCDQTEKGIRKKICLREKVLYIYTKVNRKKSSYKILLSILYQIGFDTVMKWNPVNVQQRKLSLRSLMNN